jgi:hypothetical protein
MMLHEMMQLLPLQVQAMINFGAHIRSAATSY